MSELQQLSADSIADAESLRASYDRPLHKHLYRSIYAEASSPTSDSKEVFGEEANKDLLIDFLNEFMVSQ